MISRAFHASENEVQGQREHIHPAIPLGTDFATIRQDRNGCPTNTIPLRLECQIAREIRVALLNGVTVAILLGIGTALVLGNTQLGMVIAEIETRSGYPAMTLPMLADYFINLGFEMNLHD